MKFRISFLAIFLLVPSFVIGEIEQSNDAPLPRYRVHSKEEVFKLVFEKQKQNVSRETLLQTLSKTAVEFAPLYMPFVINFLFDSARSMICDGVSSYVPDSHKLIDQPFLQINSRDAARIGLEGLSKVALLSLLHGSRDENDDFKLFCNKEIIAEGVSASVKYALVNHLLLPNLKGAKLVSNESRNTRLKNYVIQGSSYSYDGVFLLIKKYCIR